MAGVADTYVMGEFYQAGARFIAFDPTVLPWKQFCSWVKPPDADDTEYYISYDEEGISLRDFKGLEVSGDIFDRGVDYYRTVQVQYLCLNGGKGRAIVAGTRPYEIEFQYQDGQVSNLRNMRRFYLTFPIQDALRPELSWTHYRFLMKVNDAKARAFYLAEYEKLEDTQK